MLMLPGAPAKRIETINYLLAGLEPTPSADELVGMVRKKIPAASIDFEVDEEVQTLLDKMLRPIVDTNARSEWGWTLSYGLEEMVDDFLLELKKNPQRNRNHDSRHSRRVRIDGT